MRKKGKPSKGGTGSGEHVLNPLSAVWVVSDGTGGVEVQAGVL